MRTSRLSVLILSCAFIATAFVAVAQSPRFKSAEEALDQGIAAFNGGFYEIALPALEAVQGEGSALARLYIARIYADNNGTYTDHGKAYEIYRQLADELQNVDADDDKRSTVAAKALTAVSGYLRSGIPSAGVSPDIEEANRMLSMASGIFGDEDAEFEMSKVLLRGEGPDELGEANVESKVLRGRDLLSRLSRKGHAGAQAFLADLLWRGKYVRQDQVAALALIDVAVANAPPHERVWIDDIYQNIFCNAGEGVREQATGRVAEWHNRYKRTAEPRVDRTGLAGLEAARPFRTCSNGEPVLPILRQEQAPAKPDNGGVIMGRMPSIPTIPTLMPRSAPPAQDVGVGYAPRGDR